MVKDRFIFFSQYRAEAMQPTQIMYSVHSTTSSEATGAMGSPVPIMASRVTSSLRRSSLHPCVPEGCSGSTR